MSITCLNLKNEVVKRNFDELASIVGADRAETLLVKNNGYSLDRIPDGSVRDRYLELMDKTNQNRRFVLKKIAEELRDGNVITDNYETKEIFGNIPYRGDYMENRRDDEEIIDDDKINLSPEELSRLEEMQIMDYLDEEEQRKELEKYEREHPEEQALVNQRFSGKKEVTVEEFIKNALADNSDFSIILDNLLPNLGELKGIKVILGNRNLLMGGLYNPDTNTISVFNRKHVDQLFIHELIHAIVHNNKNKDKYKGRFTKIYEKLKKTVFEQYGISSYNEITSPKLKYLLYGFKSEDEFISEFYSNRAFNTLVKTTEKSLSKVRNIGIVDKIIKFVEEVLGIKFDTKATRLARKIVSSFNGGIIDERTSLQTYSTNRKTNKSFSYNNIDKITAKKILYETYLKGQPLYLEPEDISHDLSEYRRFYKLYPKGRTTEDMSVDDAIRNIKQYFSTLEFVDKYGMLHPIKPVAKQRKNPIYEQVKKWINEMSEQDLIAEAWRIVLEENEDYELYEPQDIPTFNYTEGQKNAIDGILNKIKNREGDILLTGRAGTGKTTIINDIIRNLTPTRPVIVSAVAHQAKTNLLNKINPDVKKTHDIKGYSVAALLGDESTYDDNGRISFVRGNRESPISRASLIIIDEASMLNEEQLERVIELRNSTNAINAPILFIADEAQINPIRDTKYMNRHPELVGGELSPVFTNENLIKKDNKFELTEIVRQKGSSPILDYAARYSDFNLGRVKEYPNDAEFQSSDESQLAFFNNMNEVLNQPAVIEEYLKALETENPYHINIFAYTKDAVNKHNEAIQARLFDMNELDALRENGILFHDDDLVVSYDNLVVPYEENTLKNSSRAFIKLVRDNDGQIVKSDMAFSFNDINDEPHTFYLETYKIVGTFDEFPKPLTLILPTLTPENVSKIQEYHRFLLKDAIAKKDKRRPAAWADYYRFINTFCLSNEELSESKKENKNLSPYDPYICSIHLGYALTIHKAQGSTYDISIVDKDDIMSKSRIGIEASRLLYTGVTRASKTAYVVGNTNNSAIETKISDQMLASEANTVQREIDKIISHIQQMDRDLLTQKVNSKDLDLLDKLTALRAQGISINTYISNFNSDFKKQFISLLQSLVSDVNKAISIPVNLEVEMHKAETLLKHETIPETQPQTQKEMVVQQHKGDWSREEAENNPKTLYVFTDNTDRDSGSRVIPADSWYSRKYGTGHHYPTMTAAVVRGLENARPISTQRWYHEGAKGATGRWTDNEVEEFKTIIREELQEIVNEFNTGKYDTIMFPDGDGLFNTKISNITKDRTPKLYQALADLLHEFGFDALIPSDAISNSQQQQTTLPAIEIQTMEGKNGKSPLNETEKQTALEKFGTSNLKVMMASEHTDPAAHVEKLIKRIEEELKKDVKNREFHMVQVMTKHDGLPLRRLLETKIAKTVHFSITSLGGTKWEPGVMKMDDLLDRIQEFIDDKLLKPKAITIRIDPIIPGVTKEEDIRHIVERATKMGIKTFKFSVLDSYGYTEDDGANDRFVVQQMQKRGYDWEKYYNIDNGKVAFSAKPGVFDQIYSFVDNLAEEFDITINTCGEKPQTANGKSYKHIKFSEGCLSVKTVENTLGVSEVKGQRGKQRPGCSCFAGKIDILKLDDSCFSTCSYCYAVHNSDFEKEYYNEDGSLKKRLYYDEDGNLKDSIYTRTKYTMIIHSGGAPGADKIWGDIGQLYGAKVNHYYHGERSEKNSPYGNVEISDEDYNEGRFEAAKAAARNWGYKYSAVKDDKLIRNWSQVKYADTIIAIGTIAQPGEIAFPDIPNDSRKAINPMVTGGTGYAVGMAILYNKPVYVFNQKDGKWYVWDNVIGNFAETDVPKLTENTACIGSRHITNSGVKAIEDVFQKSFPELDKSILKYTSLLSDGKVQASSLTEEQRQNVVSNVEKSIDFGKHTLTEQEIQKQADFKTKYPEVYYKAISRKELLSMDNMSRKAISSVAKAFSYTLLDKLDSILYNEDELEELKENYPTIFTDKVVDALYRNKRFTNDQSVLYRLAIKEIGSNNIINMVLDELDAYSESDYDGNFNYNSSLCQKDDEGNPIFRISYLDFINPILKSISGLEFSDGLNLKETTENKKVQDDESDQFDEAESLEDDNENNTMFTFSINNLTRGFTKNLDYKIKNAFARIQMRDNEGMVKLDKFGNPLYYKKETISNGIFKAVKNCQTFDEMRDAIENSKLPFKDQVLDIVSNNPSLKTLFVKNFNKHNVSYGVTRTGEKTAIRYEPTNYSAKAEILRIKGLARLKGSKNSELAMFLYNDRRDPSAVYVNKKVLNAYASIFKDLNATKDMVIHIAYEKALQNDPTLKYEDFRENQFDTMDLFVFLSKALTKFLTDAGIIDMTVDELITVLQADDKNFGLLILGIQKCIDQLGGKFPFSGKKSILYSYRKVQNLLQDYTLSYSDPAIHFNGKTYSTTIYPCYLSQVFKKLHSDEREQFLEDTYWSVRYFGKFRNEPWFKSWLTDLEEGSPIEFVPILAHNGTSYTDLDPTQFIEMALCNYICLNDYKQAPYVMPVMSDKSMGGTITGKIFEVGSSEFSDRLFTVFMQELDRIKQVYNRALLRKGYIKNFDTILDDNKHIAFTNKANVGGGEFKLLNFLNPILEGINKPREEQTEFQRILSDYIYGDVELSELTSQYGDLDSLYEKIKDFAVSAIEDGLLNEYMEWYKDLEESGMIAHLTKAIKSDSTNNRQPVTDDFLITFFFNDFYARTQILQLLTGDITFYDNWNDLQKRIAEFISPGLKYDLTARDFSGELYSRTGKKRAMIISDFKGFLPQTKVINSVYAIKERELKNRARQANKGVLSELDKKNIEHQIAEEKAGFKKIDTTDGQGLLSLTGLRKHLGMLGSMPEGFEAFYNRVLEDVVYEKDPQVRKENWNEIKEEFPYLSFEIIKQFTYGIVKVDDAADSKSNIAIPTQVKNAEAPIVDFDSILESEDQTLFTLLEFMEKNDIDVIYTNSNVKVGGIRTTDLTKCTTQDQVKNILEENVANPEYIIEMDYNNISEQQPGLKHYEDFSADVGAQLQKILVGMLNDAMMRNEQYTLNQYQTHTNGKLRENPSKVTLTARQLRDLYNNVLAEIHNINCNELMSSLGIDNALFNKILDRNSEFTPEEVMKLNTKLSNVLSKQLENDANPNPMLIDAFSPTTTGDFQFPLNDVSLFSQMQKTLMSIIKKAATTTELSGGQLVQETDMIRLNIINKENSKAEGDDSLHIIYEDADGTLTAFPMNPIRIAHFEVKLPYYMKSMYENYKDQKDVPEELRKLICYRIPTEGACSMFPIKVVGFTSKASGGKIKMPAEITEIAGVDFDIDKMFFIAPACNKDGEYIEYDSAWGALGRSTSVKGMSMDQLNNMFLDITWSTLTSPASLTSQLSTSSFKKFIKNSQIMQIIKYHQANNTGRASEENIVDLYNELYNKSSDELKAEVDKISAAKSICSFATQTYLHNRNMTSAQEIGVFAIGRSAASILTNAHVKLLNTFGGQILFGKKLGESVELNKFLSNDDIIPIVDMIREGLAAAVDGAKSPVLSDCGFNMCLINIAMPMFYMGFSVDQIVLVLTQPITQEIAKEFYRQKNNFEHPNALNVVNGFIEQLSKEGFPFMGQSLINITKTSLIQGLSQKVVLNRDDFTISKESSSADQLQLLYLLNNLFIAADTIRNMVACVRIDQKSNSNYQNVFDLISTLLVVDNTINEAKNSEKQKKNAESDGDDFSISTSCLSKEFAEIFNPDNADYGNTNLISVRTNLKKMLYGIFGYVNPSILDFYENVVSRMSQEARKNFSSEELETMYHEYVFYNMINLTIPKEGSSLIPNTKDLSEFFGWDFPEYVSSIKPTLLSDETLRDNLFLKYLRVSNDSYEIKSADSNTENAEEVTIKTVKINTFGMPYDTQVELSNDWLELLNSSNPDANRLGKLCVFYSLFRNGGKSGKGSFLHLLPTEFKYNWTAYKNFLENSANYFTGADPNDFFKLYLRHHPELVYKANPKTVKKQGSVIKDLKIPNNEKPPVVVSIDNKLFQKDEVSGSYTPCTPLGGAVLEYSSEFVNNPSNFQSGNLKENGTDSAEVPSEQKTTNTPEVTNIKNSDSGISNNVLNLSGLTTEQEMKIKQESDQNASTVC